MWGKSSHTGAGCRIVGILHSVTASQWQSRIWSQLALDSSWHLDSSSTVCSYPLPYAAFCVKKESSSSSNLENLKNKFLDHIYGNWLHLVQQTWLSLELCSLRGDSPSYPHDHPGLCDSQVVPKHRREDKQQRLPLPPAPITAGLHLDRLPKRLFWAVVQRSPFYSSREGSATSPPNLKSYIHVAKIPLLSLNNEALISSQSALTCLLTFDPHTPVKLLSGSHSPAILLYLVSL